MAALAIGLIGGCATNPVTGKREFTLVSEGQEIEMGKGAAEEVAQTIGLYDNAATQSYVEDLGKKLAAQSERPDLPWSFQVVDDPVVNAFALPGGFIFVTRGLMAHMNSEAQLVSVSGTRSGTSPPNTRCSRSAGRRLAQLRLVAGMLVSETVAALGDVGMAGLSVLFLKYGRDAERQADDLGFKYSVEPGLRRAGDAGGVRHAEAGGRVRRRRAAAQLDVHPPLARRAHRAHREEDRRARTRPRARRTREATWR